MSLLDLVQPVRRAGEAAGTARLTPKVAAGAVGAPVRTTALAARALLDPHPRRTHRRVSAGVRRALSGSNGVRWAEINAVTGQVPIAFALGRDAD